MVPLKILFIEDSEDDMLLLLREIKKSEYKPVYKRVETQSEIKKSLTDEDWDIIITDFVLPEQDGIQTVKYIKSLKLDTPCLMISGKMGEETAIEAMRAGANDYILKSNFNRLLPAINRELEEARNRKAKKAAEQALKNSQSKYRLLFENAPLGIFLVDKNGKILSANQTFFKMLGLPEEKASEINMLNHPLFRKSGISGTIKRSIENEQMVSMELALINTRGEEIFFKLDLNQIYSEDDHFIGLQGILQNITEQKLKEKELTESHAFLNQVFASLNEAIIITDTITNKIFDCNEAVMKIFGFSKEELIGKTTKIFHVNQKQWENFLYESINQSKKEGFYEIKYSMKRKNGEVFPSENYVRPIFLNGESGKLLLVVRDLTEKSRLEEKISKSHEFYLNLFENFPNPLWRSGANGLYTYFNKAWLEFTGMELEKALDAGWANLIHPKDRAKRNKSYDEAFAEQKEYEISYRLKSKDGGYYKITESGRPFIDVNGEFSGFIGICYDITPEKLD